MILRRFAHTLLGAMAGYLVGAVVGMVAFSAIYGFRSISILEEANRNRWTFIAASAGAVAGALVAWWRSYSVVTPADDVDADGDDEDEGSRATDRTGDHAAVNDVSGDDDGDDEDGGEGSVTDPPADPPTDAPRPDQSEASA